MRFLRCEPRSTTIFDSKPNGKLKTDNRERDVSVKMCPLDGLLVGDLAGGGYHLRVARRHGLTGFPGAELGDGAVLQVDKVEECCCCLQR